MVAPLTENEVRYQNAALAAENARLRAALRELGEPDEVIEAIATGQSWQEK